MKRIYLLVSGRVQGVGFRYFCQSHAERLGLTGYARNREDGTVEVEAQGEAASVDEFAKLVSHGPRHASVGSVELKELEVRKGSGFDAY